ncbi:MAG: hypothetical protein ABI723_07075 [Bacteroidia bacterium]
MNNDQNKSFEKKLHSLSVDFELTPTADSWNKIEAQLEQKKKRRFFFWLFPVGIIALMAGVFVLNKEDLSNNKIDETLMLSSPAIKGPQQKILEGSDNTNNKINNATKTDTETSETKNEKEKNNSESEGIVNSSQSPPTTKKHHHLNNHSYAANNITLHSIPEEANEQDVSEALVIGTNHDNSEMIKIEIINSVLENHFILNPSTNNFKQIEQAKKKSHWSIGLSYLPMLSNRKVSYNLQSDNTMIIPDTSAHRKDENLFNNNFGADVYYHFNEKIYLHSGLYVINYGEKTFYDNRVYNVTSVSPTNFADFADYIVPGSETEFTNTYSFIQIPVNAGIALRTGTKTSLNIETGFSYGYLTDARALQLITLNDSLQIKAYDNAQLNRMNRNHFFGNAAISFDWFITKQISWSNGFNVQYQLTDMYKKDELQSQHNYMFGMKTGIKFHFK